MPTYDVTLSVSVVADSTDAAFANVRTNYYLRTNKVAGCERDGDDVDFIVSDCHLDLESC